MIMLSSYQYWSHVMIISEFKNLFKTLSSLNLFGYGFINLLIFDKGNLALNYFITFSYDINQILKYLDVTLLSGLVKWSKAICLITSIYT